MALDEPKEDDNTYVVNDISWLISKNEESYIDAGEGVRVDHVQSRFGSGFYVSRNSPYSTSCC